MLYGTDEEVAKAVLKRLEDKGLRSLRKQEAEAPVSRGTLNRWRGGDYDMWDDTREVCLVWLGAPAGTLTTSYADGLEHAMRRYEDSIGDAMKKTRKEIEGLVKSILTEDDAVDGLDRDIDLAGGPEEDDDSR